MRLGTKSQVGFLLPSSGVSTATHGACLEGDWGAGTWAQCPQEEGSRQSCLVTSS